MHGNSKLLNSSSVYDRILSCNKRAYLLIKCHSTYTTESVPLVLTNAVKRTQVLVVATTHELLCEKIVQEVNIFS